MSLILSLGSILVFPFSLQLSSFYGGILFLGIWVSLVGVTDSLWVSEVSGMGAWSQSLVAMSLVLTVVGIVSCPPSSHKASYNYCMLLVCIFSILAFLSEGGMLFFIFFEMTFFPISFLILMWGYNQERVVAVLYMAIYSFFGSILHLTALCLLPHSSGLIFFSGTWDFEGWGANVVLSWFAVLYLLFLVKCPLFMWHLWLSKAHVEAPTGASMSLAAILLKLGIFGVVGYGGIYSATWLGLSLQGIGVCGSVYASLICLRSQNVKLVIAQSSVAHMSLCVAAYFSGGQGALMMVCMMAVIHGFCAAGMFCWAGRYYSFGSSQSTLLGGGQRLLYLDGVSSMVLFLVCNSGIPPFISFWVELIFFTSLYSVWGAGGFLLVLSSIMCLLFNVVFGLNILHGRAESSQSKHQCYPLIEVVSLGMMIVVLLLGYMF